MKYLLDTNVVSGLMRGNPRLRARIRYNAPTDFTVSAIAYAELWFGIMSAPDGAELTRRLLAADLAVLDFSREDAAAAGEIRAFLRRAGKLIGPMDMLIAGQARARGLILVTHNTREFDRVPDLCVEDWET